MMTHKQRADLTFKDNRSRARHGWVRLTPAYSVKMVEQILDQHPDIGCVLDPFSGTGTTGLVVAQRGLRCDLYDINPFLVWLAEVKCRRYSGETLQWTKELAEEVVDQARKKRPDSDLWQPPIHNIERWWSSDRLRVLAKIFSAMNRILPDSTHTKDLILVAFCRLLIQWSNAAFNHQSMSFAENDHQPRLFDVDEEIYQVFLDDLDELIVEAASSIDGEVRTHLIDSRNIHLNDVHHSYDAVITSPPYVNRMSYIRELRPYMYWLGYLHEARDAGELDWQAIGGTWGIATSRLNDWFPQSVSKLPSYLLPLIAQIAQSSEVLSRYVYKYFVDMADHFSSLYDAVAPGGRLFYIVGNSKFYNTLVPAQDLYAELMQWHGFENPRIEIIRKRNSKKELFEFLVTAQKPL